MTIPADVIAAAQASHAKFYPLGPFASVSLAQWAIESNWGKSLSGKNNCFGIKATHDQIAANQATRRWTHETFNGVYHPIEQWFADYESLEACFMAHAKLLSTSAYYWKARAAVTPGEYAMALQGIYATGIPGHPYGEVLIDVMKQNNLYQFDQPTAPASVVAQPRVKDMTEIPTATSLNTSSGTATAPPRVVPTVSQPVRIPWLHWAEQGLVHEQGAIEQAANAGLDVVAGSIPFGSMIVGAFGQTIVHEAVTQIINIVKGLDDSGSTVITVPDNTLAEMAGKAINDAAPTFFAKAEDFLDGWLKTAIASIKP